MILVTAKRFPPHRPMVVPAQTQLPRLCHCSSEQTHFIELGISPKVDFVWILFSDLYIWLTASFCSSNHPIAGILGSLDEKIEVNRRKITELEALAKSIYDYWFVQFDFPDANGRPYKSSGCAMEWKKELKREIPKGWGFGNLYDIAFFENGLACQKHRPRQGEQALPVIKIREMHEGISEDTEFVSTSIPEKNKIEDGDLLFSWSASLETMIWCGGKAGLNQHIFKVIPRRKYPLEYVYQQLSRYIINFIKMAEARKTTMGHITADHLRQSQIILPDEVILSHFSDITAPIASQRIVLQQEVRELIKQRDMLLPLLMNGQVEVK